MTHTSPETLAVRAFFERYEAAGRSDDLTGLRDLFSPTFVAGGPSGAATITVDMLVATASARRERLQAFGHDGGRLTALEVTWLGPSYCLAVTTWELGFTPPGRAPVTLSADSDFVLHLGPEGPRIVTYLARQDLDAEVSTALG